ncbi:MAG: hypothetical protein U1F76_15630 [Candidatus Competibacteraceae bacterium]
MADNIIIISTSMIMILEVLANMNTFKQLERKQLIMIGLALVLAFISFFIPLPG